MMRLPFEIEAAQRLNDDIFETVISLLAKHLWSWPLAMAHMRPSRVRHRTKGLLQFVLWGSAQRADSCHGQN